jgi:hypothetical protein
MSASPLPHSTCRAPSCRCDAYHTIIVLLCCSILYLTFMSPQILESQSCRRRALHLCRRVPAARHHAGAKLSCCTHRTLQYTVQAECWNPQLVCSRAPAAKGIMRVRCISLCTMLDASRCTSVPIATDCTTSTRYTQRPLSWTSLCCAASTLAAAAGGAHTAHTCSYL